MKKAASGSLLHIPEGVKHWHGATRDSYFQHLTAHVHVDEPESNEWLESVNETQYLEANGFKD